MRLWFLHTVTVSPFVINEIMTNGFLYFVISISISIPKRTQLIRNAWMIIGTTLILDSNWAMAFWLWLQTFLKRILFLDVIRLYMNFFHVLNFVHLNYPVICCFGSIHFLGKKFYYFCTSQEEYSLYCDRCCFDPHSHPYRQLFISVYVGYLVSHSKSPWKFVFFYFLEGILLNFISICLNLPVYLTVFTLTVTLPFLALRI